MTGSPQTVALNCTGAASGTWYLRESARAQRKHATYMAQPQTWSNVLPGKVQQALQTCCAAAPV